MASPATKRARTGDDGIANTVGEQPVAITVSGGERHASELIRCYREHRHCDVEVVASCGQRFQAHRIVLVCGSAYMSARFTSGMCDATVPTITISLPGTSVAAILDWMYCGACTVAEADLIATLEAAAYLNMPTLLKRLASDISQRWLTICNCIPVWTFAAANALHALEADALAYAAHHFQELTATETFLSLPACSLSKLLSHGGVRAEEESIFEALWSYCQLQQPKPEILLSLLQLVRYPAMSHSYVKQVVQVHELMSSSQAKEILANSFMAAYRELPWPPLEVQGRALEESLGHLLHGCAVIPSPRVATTEKSGRIGRCVVGPTFDLSRGMERFDVTISPVLTHNGKSFIGQLPVGVQTMGLGQISDLPKFTYDAGPLPAPTKVQVFRRGCLIGRGYGLRALQNISKGSLVIVYWGEYRLQTFHEWLKDIEAELEELMGEEWGEDYVRHLERVNYRKMYWLREPANSARPAFSVDPATRGNAARWVNHSMQDPNLELSCMTETTSVSASVQLPLLGLFARRDIEYGEELLWDYSCTSAGPRCGTMGGNRKSAPAVGGVKSPPGCIKGQEELLRDPSDGALVAATWRIADTMEGEHERRYCYYQAISEEVMFLQGEEVVSGDGLNPRKYPYNLPEHPLPTLGSEQVPWEYHEVDDEHDDDEVDPREGNEWWRYRLPFWDPCIMWE